LFLDPFSENNADLDDRVLYATTSETSDDLSLVAKYPDRTPYREQASYRGDELGPRERPNTPQVAVTPLRVLRAPVVAFHVVITRPQDSPAAALFVDVDHRTRTRSLATDSNSSGTYEADIVLRATELGRSGKVIIGAGFGDTAAHARAARSVRQLFPYRVRNGNVEMLVPGVKNVKAQVGSHVKWRPVLTSTALDVEPRAATP
jgi:hypothetical protein